MDPNTTIIGGGISRTAGIGVPFALEYLFDCNCLPLGLVYHIYAEKDNNKTTFYWELTRLCQQHGGRGWLVLTEGKVSYTLADAVCGYPLENPLIDREVKQFGDMEAWQAALLAKIKDDRETMLKGKKSEGILPGAYTPICYGIDSLTGQLCASTVETMEKEGAAPRSYPVEANSLTRFLKGLQDSIQTVPAIVVGINHMKVKPGQTSFQDEKRTIGGAQIKFQATYELEMSQGPLVTELDTSGAEGSGLYIKGYDITITSDKNSLGEKRRRVKVPYRWRYEHSDIVGKQVQRAWFDWDAALVFLLDRDRQAPTTKEAKAAVAARMDDAVHLRQEVAASQLYSSKTFGISATNPIPARELGKMIQDSPEIIAKLRTLYGIKLQHIWDPEEICYFEFIKNLQARIRQAATATPAKKKKPPEPPAPPASSTSPKSPKPTSPPKPSAAAKELPKPAVGKPAASKIPVKSPPPKATPPKSPAPSAASTPGKKVAINVNNPAAPPKKTGLRQPDSD